MTKECEHCKTGIPHLHYYLENRERKYTSYEDCLGKVWKERFDYLETLKDGFLPEMISFCGSTDIEELMHPDKIKTIADREWDIDNNCRFSLMKVAVTNLSEFDTSSLKNFHRWK